jgi:hypothetical protein
MHSLSSIVGRVRSRLARMGFKTTLPRSLGACVELGIEYKGKTLFVYVYPGRFSEALVAKIVPAMCGCDRALLCPQGLYAIAEEEVLADAIRSKLERALAIARMVEEVGLFV